MGRPLIYSTHLAIAVANEKVLAIVLDCLASRVLQLGDLLCEWF